MNRIENPTQWLADVSKICRKITEQAVVAMRDARDEELPWNKPLDAAKVVLVEHLEKLDFLLPEDFPISRIGHLARHIHFCQQGDCVDIAAFDIPDILEKAEKYAVSHIPEAPSGDIGDYLHAHYRARLDREMVSAEPDYHALVLKASVLLGDTFKQKTGVRDDKDAEIGKAFRLDKPKLKVMPDLSSETNQNFQRGTMLLLQGVRAFYRNTHSHGIIDTSQKHAVHALIIMSVLTEIIEHSEIVSD
jgi:uncharacterized protein (TIGR02391 family)